MVRRRRAAAAAAVDLGRAGARGGPADPRPGGGGAGTVRRVAALRRGRVPAGRAAAGGLLVALAALLAFTAARGGGEPPGRPVVVAARDVPPGTTLTEADLALSRMALPDGWDDRVAGRAAQLVGAVTVAPLRQGDLVQASSVVAAANAPGGFEVAMALPADRAVQDRLRPGERVDVLVTFGTGAPARTDVVVRDALVQQRSVAGGRLGGDQVAVTLAVADQAQVLALTHALRAGEVTLVRATGSPTSGGEGGPVSWPPATAAPA